MEEVVEVMVMVMGKMVASSAASMWAGCLYRRAMGKMVASSAASMWAGCLYRRAVPAGGEDGGKLSGLAVGRLLVPSCCSSVGGVCVVGVDEVVEVMMMVMGKIVPCSPEVGRPLVPKCCFSVSGGQVEGR
eukprot:1157618-Pelagomonas_calceolata.AAC.4